MVINKRGPKSPMTDEHKAALAEGRKESRVVKNYLDALDSHRPKRGRRRTAESITQRLDEIDSLLPEADAVSRLFLCMD